MTKRVEGVVVVVSAGREIRKEHEDAEPEFLR